MQMKNLQINKQTIKALAVVGVMVLISNTYVTTYIDGPVVQKTYNRDGSSDTVNIKTKTK